jgi:leucyl-tRNA synthetase
VWRLMDMLKDGKGYQAALVPLLHETIKKVGDDYEAMKYNTAIAQMMTLVNEFYAAEGCTREELKTLILLLYPVAPHIGEEMWERMSFGSGITLEPWPRYDEQAMKRSEIEIAVQILGKVRGRILIHPDMTAEQAEKELPSHPQVKALVGDRQIVKLIFVPGRLCNLIVK